MGLEFQTPRHGTGFLCPTGEGSMDKVRSGVWPFNGYCSGDRSTTSPVCGLATPQAVCAGVVQQVPM